MPEDKTEKRIEVTVTHLEQSARPVLAHAPHPPGKVALLRVEDPAVHYYRYLYRLVGDPYKWVSRRRMSDEDLREIITHERVFIYVLYINGAPAGFAEIDARAPATFELKFFGLSPDFVGKGFGRYFLTNVIDLAWSLGPESFRVETCTLDHPAALSLYQKCGFEVTNREKGVVELID